MRHRIVHTLLQQGRTGVSPPPTPATPLTTNTKGYSLRVVGHSLGAGPVPAHSPTPSLALSPSHVSFTAFGEALLSLLSPSLSPCLQHPYIALPLLLHQQLPHSSPPSCYGETSPT